MLFRSITVEEHALEHKRLYEENGRLADKIAWLALAGQITKQELLSASCKVGREKTNLLLEQTYGKNWRSELGKYARNKLTEKVNNNEQFASELKEIAKNNLKLASKAALSNESKNKRKHTFKRINHQKGIKNSQYGTIWITDGVANKKLQKHLPIPLGWIKGRYI